MSAQSFWPSPSSSILFWQFVSALSSLRIVPIHVALLMTAHTTFDIVKLSVSSFSISRSSIVCIAIVFDRAPAVIEELPAMGEDG